ncbi:MAG TPA: 5'-nucleotidase C-terminal domain-containing protein, partial [Candidatus Eremiobacteraeota bacterium]|nr:5'-nucleotidase C-terminal domain-containing protein [Candidatus Eremiobacteraeota bacterium]
ILFDGGDIAQGTLYSNLTYGISMIDLMNKTGYDFSVIGNHDFDWGKEKLGHMISKAHFTFLSSNLVTKEQGEFIAGTRPYALKNIEDIRIGIIGLACTDTTVFGPESNISNYYIFSGEETLKFYIPILKEIHKADLIIVLSHLGYEEDVKLVSKVPGIDIIIGAHTHKVIEKPVLKDKTIIVQAGNYLAYLGKLEIEIDKSTKKIINHKGELITILNSQIEPDKEVKYILDKYREKYEAFGDTIIGETSTVLTKIPYKECTLGNLIADSIKITAGVDIGLINSGGLRDNIPVGPVTMEKIYRVYPFENMLISLDLSGKDIMEIIEQSFSGFHAILQVSGLKVKYDSSKPKNQRVIEIMVNNKPLDPKKIYRVATADFLALGGDGYNGFKKGKNLQNVMLIRDAIIKYFQEHSPVSGKIEGRLENSGKEK